MVNATPNDNGGNSNNGTKGQAEEEPVRSFLAQLIRQSGKGYAEISRMLGRNPAYIQQFIKRGIPRRLSETDRQILSAHFGVSEKLLGAPTAPETVLSPDSAIHQRRSISLTPLQEQAGPVAQIDSLFLPPSAISANTRLAFMAVEGDSMAPTLLAGDHVLVDIDDHLHPRDGIYVINTRGAPMIRRVAVHPITRRMTLLADNAAYPSFADCDPLEIEILGRAVWLSRSLP